MVDGDALVLYCIEVYREAKNMDGKTVLKLFRKYDIDKIIRKLWRTLTGEDPEETVLFLDGCIDRYMELGRMPFVD